MAATAQLNVRMDPQLKAAGDAALAEIGFSPSQAVRALWERAACRGEGLAQAKSFLNGTATAQALQEEHAEPEISDAERFGWNIVSDGMAKLGIVLKPHDDNWPSDEELLVQALEERMQERGTA